MARRHGATCSFVNNTGVGIVIAPASGIIGAALDNVRSANNSFGLAVGTGGRVMVKNSVFTSNTTAGIEADSGATIHVNTSLVSYNSTGVVSSGTVLLSDSAIDSNSTAISGAARSSGNNRIFANSSDGTGLHRQLSVADSDIVALASLATVRGWRDN